MKNQTKSDKLTPLVKMSLLGSGSENGNHEGQNGKTPAITFGKK